MILDFIIVALFILNESVLRPCYLLLRVIVYGKVCHTENLRIR